MNSKARDLLVEAAALVLQGAGGGLHITSLNKALFYADLHALVQTGRPITSTAYIALPAGPVIAKYQQRLVSALEEAGLAEQDVTDDSSKPMYLTGNPTRKLVAEEHVGILRSAGEWARSKTATQLSDYSHDNPGWMVAYENGLKAGRPALAINLRIAIQQLVDDDPWMSTADD